MCRSVLHTAYWNGTFLSAIFLLTFDIFFLLLIEENENVFIFLLGTNNQLLLIKGPLPILDFKLIYKYKVLWILVIQMTFEILGWKINNRSFDIVNLFIVHDISGANEPQIIILSKFHWNMIGMYYQLAPGPIDFIF